MQWAGWLCSVPWRPSTSTFIKELWPQGYPERIPKGHRHTSIWSHQKSSPTGKKWKGTIGGHISPPSPLSLTGSQEASFSHDTKFKTPKQNLHSTISSCLQKIKKLGQHSGQSQGFNKKKVRAQQEWLYPMYKNLCALLRQWQGYYPQVLFFKQKVEYQRPTELSIW